MRYNEAGLIFVIQAANSKQSEADMIDRNVTQRFTSFDEIVA